MNKFVCFPLSLLKLMEESELTLETFWKNHFVRLNKCLDLRKFEQKFKDVRTYIYYIPKWARV